MREGLLPRRLYTETSAPPSRKATTTLTTPSNPSSPETVNPGIPTAAQLAETRLKQWHQQGEALLTMENLRSWINTAGLVLFVPRPQIVAPAPSLVETVLGEPVATPTIEQTTEARSLLARLVAEGLAVPLNLLGAGAGTVHAGAPGDTPDFVASTAVFSYVFTLRGDKAWKQPPVTSGAFKVSPLALATHEALSQRGPLSAYDLTTEVGKEVTEAAVLRALGELWAHLRVLPLAQAGENATLWELTGARFTKQIKAGANAGQPSALSALISLYLGQAVVASEDEIESFLSPLASRSRIRDVIHALLSARQLETVAVEGRTMLHVAGELPAFLAPEAAAVEGLAQAADVVEGESAVEADAAAGAEGAVEGAPRITKFIPKPRKIGTGYLAKAKPSNVGAKPGPYERGTRPGFGAKTAFGAKPGFRAGFKARAGAGPAPDRERRPFSKTAAAGFKKTAGFDKTAGFKKTGGFDKPWEEEKRRRLAAAARPSEVPAEFDGSQVDLAAAGAAGDAARPVQPREPRVYKPRTEKPRTEGRSSDARPPRKTFSKPGTFGRKREGSAARPAFGSARAPGSYAPRPSGGTGFSGKPRFSKSSSNSNSKDKFAGKPFAGKPRDGGERGFSTESGKRVYRKFDAPRERPSRPFSSDRPARPYSSDRPARPYSSDRPARTARAEGTGGSAGKPAGEFAPRKFAGKPFGKPGGFAGKKPFGKSSGKPSGFSGKPPGDSAPRKFAGKPGGFAGKKPFGKSSGKPGGFAGKKPFGRSAGKPGGAFPGKPSSTFAKFAGNKKPFGKRAPARKFKPGKDESA
jgi:23S rRNA pseudouridine2605 synthase